MRWLSFKRVPKKFLGIDIGTSSIRVVELSQKHEKRFLENYGEIKIFPFQKIPFGTFEKNNFSLSTKETAKGILTILKEAGIQTKDVNFSIPDFTSFFTYLELPSMTEKEIPSAITYEARNYIPLPLSELTLDWSIIEKKTIDSLESTLKILVIAIPNETVYQCEEIAKLAGLHLKSLEAEAFSLTRSLAKNNKENIGIIDIGARSTTCNIIENGILKTSHSFNFSGNEMTEILSKSLEIDYEQAEECKKNVGIKIEESTEKKIREILLPLIDAVLIEIKKIFANFHQEGKEITKVVLTGGSCLLPGLKDYFFEKLEKPVEIANPFLDISYPAILKELLEKMGPTYAIAVGLALKGFEK